MVTTQKPVAIRITRPYQTEEEFFAAELETISRTGVTLVGAQQRPDGGVLRFELTLADGAPLIRGEGRVVGYKANAWHGESGLSLRFTRLDSKSKMLVDRVGALRDARRSIPPPSPSSRSLAERDGVLPPPVPVQSAPSLPTSSGEIPISTSEPQIKEAPPQERPQDATETENAKKTVVRAVDRDPSREATLARLRSREVPQVEIERILADGASRRRR